MLKRTGVALVFLCVVFLYQNCGNTHKNNSSNNTNSAESAAELAELKANIYIYQEGYPLNEETATRFAQFLYQRLAGLKAPPTDSVIRQMVNELKIGNKLKAAEIATQASSFIDVTVRDFATKMSTREGITVSPLNDFIATIMGVVRDNKTATQLLNGSQYYALSSSMNTATLLANVLKSNSHYEAADTALASISPSLVVLTQKVASPDGTTVSDHPDAAGLLTTRNYMQTHAFQGTNRRIIEYAFKVFLCSPIDSWASTTNPDSHIGRDIGREPVEEYNNKCKGCHTGMDGMRPAAAYYDFNQTDAITKAGWVQYKQIYNTSADHVDDVGAQTTSTFVPPKFRKGANIFEGGYVVRDDSWVNYADAKLFGWNGATEGNGLKGLGNMIATSNGFSKCMAKRVFKSVCGEDIEAANTGLVEKLANQFIKNNYNLRQLFVQVAVRPECGGGI